MESASAWCASDGPKYETLTVGETSKFELCFFPCFCPSFLIFPFCLFFLHPQAIQPCTRREDVCTIFYPRRRLLSFSVGHSSPILWICIQFIFDVGGIPFLFYKFWLEKCLFCVVLCLLFLFVNILTP